jgi:hypothetical protein
MTPRAKKVARPGDSRTVPEDHGEEQELEKAAAVALLVLRRSLIEGVAATRETLVREAAAIWATDQSQAALRLDSQAQRLGVSSLL